MAVQRERITVHFVPHRADQPSTPNADAAIRALAQLIGRQMAREHFEQQLAAERKARKKRSADG